MTKIKVKSAKVFDDNGKTVWLVVWADGHRETGEADDYVDGINECANTDQSISPELDDWRVFDDGTHVYRRATG